jgi:hypothetical protein
MPRMSTTNHFVESLSSPTIFLGLPVRFVAAVDLSSTPAPLYNDRIRNVRLSLLARVGWWTESCDWRLYQLESILASEICSLRKLFSHKEMELKLNIRSHNWAQWLSDVVRFSCNHIPANDHLPFTAPSTCDISTSLAKWNIVCCYKSQCPSQEVEPIFTIRCGLLMTTSSLTWESEGSHCFRFYAEDKIQTWAQSWACSSSHLVSLQLQCQRHDVHLHTRRRRQSSTVFMHQLMGVRRTLVFRDCQQRRIFYGLPCQEVSILFWCDFCRSLLLSLSASVRRW